MNERDVFGDVTSNIYELMTAWESLGYIRD